MLTIDEDVANAPSDICFEVAADVERWPEILPHYRWVRFHDKEGFARGVVEMAAWRNFPGLPYPTWWVSEMKGSPETGEVRYRHVDGITRGMDVLWTVTEEEDRTRLRIVHEWDGPRWSLVGSAAANLVIGPWFISHIAGRTLAGVVAEAERRAAARTAP
jgi:aromatase